MRVLVLTHELPPIGGGGGRIALELARQMAVRGHVLDIVTPAYGAVPPIEEQGNVRVHRVPCHRQHIEFSTSSEKLSYLWRALRQVGGRREEYDLVHAHFILPAGLIARYGGLALPYLITSHGSDVPGHNPYESGREHAVLRPLWRQVVGRAAAVVSPSDNLAALIRQAAPSLGDKLHHVPNGYPAGRWRPSSHQPRVLMVSRLIELKGFQWFLRGLEGVRLPYEVNIVGDGPMRAELEHLASRTPTEVRFHGWLDNDHPLLRELFETCAIFVFPSDAENFPTVLLEAMDAGMAIVTTNVKGCPEVVGDCGLTVPPRSPEALLAAVQGLVQDPTGAAELGARARRRLLEHFDWPIIGEQYNALYEAVAHEAR